MVQSDNQIRKGKILLIIIIKKEVSHVCLSLELQIKDFSLKTVFLRKYLLCLCCFCCWHTFLLEMVIPVL